MQLADQVVCRQVFGHRRALLERADKHPVVQQRLSEVLTSRAMTTSTAATRKC